MTPMRNALRTPSRKPGDAGIVALITVIVFGAIMLSMGIVTALVAQTQMLVAYSMGRERVARELVITCLDEAVYRLRQDSGYLGGTVPLDGNTCVVTVSGSGASRTVAATASVGGYVKAFTATATLKQNAALNAKGWSITAWQESDPP